MKEYLAVLQDVLDNGVDRDNRTGIPSRALFGKHVTVDLQDGFPAVTTKKLAFKAMRAELIWFLSGSRDERYLERLGAKIWRANAEAPYWKPKAEFEGDVGRIYGVQWRSWRTPNGEEIDQVTRLIDGLKNDPFDRRHIITAWNPGELDQMALPPCHLLYQFHVDGENGLHLTMYQRSCDMFLGVPFNIASCGLFTYIIAQIVGMTPRTVQITLADAHIYHNHFDAVREQLSREPFTRPRLSISPDITNAFVRELKGRDNLTREDLDALFSLENYEHHPAIKAEMAV